MNLKLSYYAPAYEVHKQVLKLLKEIKLKYGMDYEMVDLRNGYTNEKRKKRSI